MITVNVLIAAKSLIADPAHWTQGSLAKDSEGNDCDPCAPEAVCWCVYGAVGKITGTGGGNSFSCGSKTFDRLLRKAARKVKLPVWRGSTSAASVVNDEGGHSCVMELLDKAIELAKL